MPPKGERRKQQIIDTAKEMFISRGFQSTHIGQICEELDIARGTVYQYFSNKKEILYAILDSVAETIEDILDPDDLKDFFELKQDNETIVKFIDNRIASCLVVLSEEPIVIKLIYRDIAGIDEEVSEHVTGFLEKAINIIAREISELRDHNIFRQNIDSTVASSMLVGSVMMIIYQYSKTNRDYLDRDVTKAITLGYLHGVYEFPVNG